MHLHVQSGNPEIVEHLHRAGADINTINSFCKTPFDRVSEILSGDLYFENHRPKYEKIENYLKAHGAKKFEDLGKPSRKVRQAIIDEKLWKLKWFYSKDRLLNELDCDGGRPIHAAAQKGNVRILNYLLKVGADVESRNFEGRIPVHIAAMKGKTDALNLLLDNGSDPNAQDYFGETPLHLASKHNRPKAVRILLLSGADPDSTDYFNNGTPLMEAAGKCHLKITKALMEAGADINIKGVFIKETALISSLMGGCTEVAQFLVDSGADVHDPELNNPPISMMLHEKSGKSLKFLLDQGINPNFTDFMGTPLLSSAPTKEAIEILVNAGANVNHKSETGLTPIMSHTVYYNFYPNENSTHKYLKSLGAKYSDDAELNFSAVMTFKKFNPNDKDFISDFRTWKNWLKENKLEYTIFHAVQFDLVDEASRFIKSGADIDALYYYGRGPLHQAARKGSISMVKLLLKHGADIDLPDQEGRSPLFHAIGSCPDKKNKKTRLELVAEYLIKKGAKVDLTDFEGKTPLHYADLNTTKVLIDIGMQVNATSYDGSTPLHSSIPSDICSEKEKVMLLLENGADPNIRNKDGKTAYDVAIQFGKYDIADILKEHMNSQEPADVR